MSMANAEGANIAPNTKNPLENFLSPESMLTPGVAGALTMMITNALALNFEASRAWTGLAISFLFGLAVLAVTTQWWLKPIYYILNSLIIFCVALGANNVADTRGSHEAGFAIIGRAHAQTARKSEAFSPLTAAADRLTSYDELTKQFQSVIAEIDEKRKAGAAEADLAELTQKRDSLDQQRTALIRQTQTDLNGLRTVSEPRPLNRASAFFAPWKF